VFLREATMDDALDLLQWKNDWDTRRFSIVTDAVILWVDHIRWLERRLHNPGFFIIMEGDEKLGDLRFDIGEEIEVSIRICRKHRSKGVATNALRMGMELYKPLVAKVVDGNVGSYTLFTHAGFIPVEHREENGRGYTILKRD
jgi:UDP-4-amino-4,6-dideoxy-N-acetyl-beta-L-altrosamine N-acetyltransferase